MAGKGTPAIVAAEKAGIVFSVHEYAPDPGAQSFGLEAAEKLDVDPARVFKTLVVDLDGTLVVAIVPVATKLDLRVLGKRVMMAEPKLAERTTGYIAGGISPLGQRKPLPTVIDDSACAFETIYVSAGRRGLEIELAPADLLALTGGKVLPIAKAEGTAFHLPR
jgi:Cys-tRNA(Pro)/Cys-tRNA(Cys) deacylase